MAAWAVGSGVNYAAIPPGFRTESPVAVESRVAYSMPLAGTPVAQPRVRPSSDAESVAARDLLGAIASDRSDAAFADLFQRYAGRLKHFFVRGGIDADRAEELTQDVLLSVWRRAGTFDESRASALTWLYSLARHRRIDELRLRGNTAPTANDLSWDFSRPPSTERTVDSRRREAGLKAALADLPAEQRDVLERTFFDGKSLAMIAEESGLPLGTVKSRARLAIARLRRTLHADEEI